jgi:hypothetical protein
MTNENNKMPHIGQLIKELLVEKHYSQSDLGRLLNTQVVTIYRLVGKPTISSEYLWKIGNILNINLFSLLAQYHPVKTPTPNEIALEKQVNELQKEIAIYKELLRK